MNKRQRKKTQQKFGKRWLKRSKWWWAVEVRRVAMERWTARMAPVLENIWAHMNERSPEMKLFNFPLRPTPESDRGMYYRVDFKGGFK